MNDVVARLQGRERSNLIPYLVVGLAWFLFFMVASRVKTIEPIFLWVATQGLIAEALLGNATKDIQTASFLAAYLALMAIGWFVVERRSPEPAGAWRRAALTSIGVLFAYIIVATVLFQTGIVHE